MSAESFSYRVSAPSRAQGYNAVRHSAYLTGAALWDEREARYHQLGSQERVVDAAIEVPEDAPEWLRKVAADRDHEYLWNLAELAEGNGQKRSVYRSIILALDDGLTITREDGSIDRDRTAAMQRSLVQEHVRQFTSMGMVADWAIHWDDGFQNPHAHIMLTRRRATENGFHHLKDGARESGSRGCPAPRPWKDRAHTERWRADWARLQNRELERLGRPYRLDHRSFVRRGLQLTPEEKHFNNPERERENVKRRAAALERLLRNPRPILDALGKSFVAPFSAADLRRYVERQAKGASKEQAAALLEKVTASPELLPLKDGRYSTRGIEAGRAQKDFARLAPLLGRLKSWRELDQAVGRLGWRLEAVSRYGRLSLELIDQRDPERRTSAWRVDRRLGAKALRSQFGESRVKHELRSVAREARTLYKGFGRAAWEEARARGSLEREALLKRYHAFRRHWEVHRREAGPLSIGDRVIYRVSRWVWQRRLRQLDRRREVQRDWARRRQASMRQQGQQAADEAVRKRRSKLGFDATANTGREQPKQEPRRRKVVSAQGRDYDAYRRQFASYQKDEAELDRLVLQGDISSKEYRRLALRARENGRKLYEQSEFWKALQEEEGADHEGIRRLQRQQQREEQERPRRRDLGRER